MGLKNIAENKQGTAKPRNRFQKGVSGNPGGRPKRSGEELDVIASCKLKTAVALDTIERIMVDGENERNRLAAALSIIERAWGKATQPIAHSGELTVMTDEQRKARIAELQAKAALKK